MSDASAFGNVEQEFERQLLSILKNLGSSVSQNRIAVAYSGGLDSSVLLNLAAHFCKQHQIPLYAFHIHHGLSSHANAWVEHCQNAAKILEIPFYFRSVLVKKNGQGIEAAARELRYQALGSLCAEYDISLILTGHHLDDQAETVLMQLLRGTGLNGLSGMDTFNFAPSLLMQKELLIARPLLAVSRIALHHLAKERSIAYIEDESNIDVKYKRNAIRHRVMPVLEQVTPGFVERVSRTAQHIRASNQILKEVAREDLARCGTKDKLSINALKLLSKERVDLVLRLWLSLHNVKMPSTSKLAEIKSQLLSSRDDAQVTLFHENIELHRYANDIFIVQQQEKKVSRLAQFQVQWQGEESIYIPQFKGTLKFQAAKLGVDSDWLKKQFLTCRERQGGERLRLAKNRPSRSIKSHFQTNRTPFWQRQQLPMLYIGEQLFYVASLGIDAHFLNEEHTNLINISWFPD